MQIHRETTQVYVTDVDKPNPMFLHFIRSLHFLKDVSDFFRFISAVCTCLRSLHVIRCFSYVSALYTFVTFFLRDLLFFLSTSISCHGMFFLCICIVYVCNVFLRDLLFFFCLHPFHVMGWFSYVFALYTFVTFFLRVAVFCLTQTGISCLRSLHVMGWVSYVFA